MLTFIILGIVLALALSGVMAGVDSRPGAWEAPRLDI
jgi:hypothetical protein